MSYSDWFLVFYGFVFGVIVGWVLAKLHSSSSRQLYKYRDMLAIREEEKRKRTSASDKDKFRKQRDIEENIGKRFAIEIELLLRNTKFWVEHYRVISGEYEVNVGEASQNSFLTIRVSLSDPEEPPIHILLRWPDEKWDCGMDELSINRSIVMIETILHLRYPDLFK